MKLEAALEKLYSDNCPQGLQLSLIGNKIGAQGAQALALSTLLGHPGINTESPN